MPDPSDVRLPDLNADVLSHIFSFLDFRGLIRCEMTCKAFQAVIRERRLFWQLSKRLVLRPNPFQRRKGKMIVLPRVGRTRVKRLFGRRKKS